MNRGDLVRNFEETSDGWHRVVLGLEPPMKSLSHSFYELIDGMEVAHNEAGLASAADRVARRLGFRWFAYLASTQRDLTIISSYPTAWVRHYREQQFERIDPVVRPAQWPQRAFSWDGDTSDRRTPTEQRFFGEARAFRIRCGVTVPIRTGGGSFAAFTFAADERENAFKPFTTEAIDILQLMGLYYHAHVYAKLLLGLDRIENAPLTPRETQCLTWAARGKTMADTAQILGITKRTVEFHLDNARTKLNAVTVPQAIAESIRRDLLPRN